MPVKKKSPSTKSAKKDSPEGVAAATGEKPARTETTSSPDTFPIVGIGASAGGVEALENFFAHMPSDCQMAFVIVQHLDPHHKSMMDSLLAKQTHLTISDAADSVRVQPGQVYLKPPGKDMIMRNRTLHLQKACEKGKRLQIDTFFRSLATDQKEKAICVILSGASNDGTLGARMIKGEGGLVVVQDEKQAQYNSMPRSVIDAGVADIVLPVEEIPSELLRYLQHPFLSQKPADTPEEEFEKNIGAVLMMVRTQTGHDFSGYKRNTVRRRIERRMALHQIHELSDYRRYLRQNAAEVTQLFKDLTINVTSFFRDDFVFKVLKEEALKPRLADLPQNSSLRIWVPGCAGGEEAYSIAMLAVEVSEELEKFFNLKLFGTDINIESIEAARNGVFPDSIASDISNARLKRFFAKKGSTYEVDSKIRDAIVFAVHDITRDPPFSEMDLISCRNLLIYMDNSLQRQVLPVLHYALKPEGILMLGTSESAGEAADLFAPLSKKAKVFKSREIKDDRGIHFKMPAALHYQRPKKPIQEKRHKETLQQERQKRDRARSLIEKTILEKYAHPAVLLDEAANILYFHGNTGRYLTMPSGEPDFNIFTMVSGELHYRLSRALEKLKTQKKPMHMENIQTRHDDSFLSLDLLLTPISSGARTKDWLLVEFKEQQTGGPAVAKDTPEEDRNGGQVADLQRELQASRQELQATIEELETSNEELKSANEELQANNEELQSTNEELESSKEELQSTNEELETVNSELYQKNKQLYKAEDDLKNLFAATDIGTLFLDNDLRIKRFTPAATEAFNLKDIDAGRSISDITCNMEYDKLAADAEEVLDTLSRKELKIRSKSGKSFVMRIVPYRSSDNVIEGVAITFLDVSRFENSMLQGAARNFFEIITAELREPHLMLDGGYTVIAANKAFYRFFRTSPQKTLDQQLFDLGNQQWEIEELRQFLEDIIPLDKHFEDYEVEADFPRIGRRKMLLSARRIETGNERPDMILLNFKDVTK